MTNWRIRDFHSADLDGILHLWESLKASNVEPVYALSEVLASCEKDHAVVAVDQTGNSVSPCSPTMLAWTLGTATPARRASSQRSREVSRTVPEEKMRPAGSPEIFCAATVRTSQGLVTRT